MILNGTVYVDQTAGFESALLESAESMKPVYVGEMDDSDLLRKKIIDMTYAEWKSATRKLYHELRKRYPFHLG